MRADGFDVVAPDLQMGVLRFGRRNSVLRSALRLVEPRLVVGGALGLGLAGFPWVALGAFAAVAAVRQQAVIARAVAASFDACVAVARSALADAKPDVVVGSSWGGAVATQLGWTGRLILLAPAVAKVEAWMRRPLVVPPLTAVVFHDPNDDTVPFADSEALARAHPGVALRRVSAGGHRLMGLLDSGALAAEIRGP